jgi:hypothetical protein
MYTTRWCEIWTSCACCCSALGTDPRFLFAACWLALAAAFSLRARGAHVCVMCACMFRYDLCEDPWELHNVAYDVAPRYRAALQEMTRRLGDWSMRTEDATPIPMPALGARGAISATPDGRRRAAKL